MTSWGKRVLEDKSTVFHDEHDLGITEGTEFLTERMDSMKENWRAAYYTEEGFKSPDSKYVDDRANAMLALSVWPGRRTTPSSPMWS